jgi:hypothetical protein
MDNVNDQPILHHLYTIICHMYITTKINNLNDDMCQMKKGLGSFILQIDNGSSLSI